MNPTLPVFLQAELAAPPRAGEGVHQWLFKVARQLLVHLPATEIIALLETKVGDCGRAVPHDEIVKAVQNAMPCAWAPSKSTAYRPTAPATSKWPAVNQERRAAVIADGPRLAELWELSPIRIDSNESRAEEIIDHLFPPGALLCCGASQSEFATKTREEWRGQLAGLQFICPNPMSERTGLTQAGQTSAHTLNNTGPRRFLVCEFDTGTVDEQAAIVGHLGMFAPLVCVVHSGGKSLHAWYLVAGQLEDKVLRFFRYAVSLGADSALWTRSQFCRMPDGVRDNGKRQAVFFLNFKPLGARHE